MTAPAIYRYFPSLDALVHELTEDLYDELREAIETARDTAAADDPTAQLTAMARAFRRWSMAHPTEFELMFGNPVPGVAEFEGGLRLARPRRGPVRCRRSWRRSPPWQQSPFVTPPAALIEEELGPPPYSALPARLRPACRSSRVRLPVRLDPALRHGGAGGVRPHAVGRDRHGALFELELATFVDELRGR